MNKKNKLNFIKRFYRPITLFTFLLFILIPAFHNCAPVKFVGSQQQLDLPQVDTQEAQEVVQQTDLPQIAAQEVAQQTQQPVQTEQTINVLPLAKCDGPSVSCSTDRGSGVRSCTDSASGPIYGSTCIMTACNSPYRLDASSDQCILSCDEGYFLDSITNSCKAEYVQLSVDTLTSSFAVLNQIYNVSIKVSPGSKFNSETDLTISAISGSCPANETTLPIGEKQRWTTSNDPSSDLVFISYSDGETKTQNQWSLNSDMLGCDFLACATYGFAKASSDCVSIKTCAINQHLDGGACINNTRSCPIVNGTGTQVWSNNTWGACQFSSCNPNYHLEAGVCVRDPITLALPNSVGCVGLGASWGSCSLNINLNDYFPGIKAKKVTASFSHFGLPDTAISFGFKGGGQTLKAPGNYSVCLTNANLNSVSPTSYSAGGSKGHRANLALDSTLNTLSLSAQSWGWGDCGSNSCTACIGNVVLTVEPQ